MGARGPRGRAVSRSGPVALAPSVNDHSMSADGESRFDYRALLACEGTGEWLPTATEELGAWLSSKNWPLDLASDLDQSDGPRKFQLLRHEGQGGKSLRAQLTEAKTPTGTWLSEITAFEGLNHEGWVRIHVRNDRGRFVDVPRVAKAFIEGLQLRDGHAVLHATPQVYRPDRLEDLVRTLTDPNRNGLVLVAGTDSELNFDSFFRRMERWTRQVYGLAQVIVLDPLATEQFNDRWGSHSAAPWTIRTYFPAVDPDSVVDARRHRFVGTARLAGSDRSVELLLGRVARVHASRRHAPSEVVRIRRAFDRIESRLVFSEIRGRENLGAPATPGVVSSPATAESAETWLRDILNIEDPSKDAVLTLAERLSQAEGAQAMIGTLTGQLSRAQSLIDALEARAEASEDAVRELESANEDAQLEAASAYQRLEDVVARNRWIESRLEGLAAYDVLHGEMPAEFATTYPQNFDELLERLSDSTLEGVLFCGNVDVTRRLAEVDTLDQALRRSWDAVLCLRDYVRARAEDTSITSVGGYIRRTPAKFTGYPPGRHAETETGETMRRWGAERRFPVPPNVDPSGECVMKAHFKLASIGTVDPRMYYLDQWPIDGRVYIGYIGTHLTNTQTSKL